MTPSFAVALDPVGAHVHVRVFVGQPGSRALAGTLVMRPEEAKAFEALVDPLPEPARRMIAQFERIEAAVAERATAHERGLAGVLADDAKRGPGA